MLCVMPWFNTFKTDFMDGFLTFSCMGGGIIYSIWNFHRIFQLLRCPWGRKERLMSITYTVIQAPESVFALKSWEQWGFLWWGCTHRALGSTSCVCSLILFSNDSLRLDTVTPVLENRRTWLWDLSLGTQLVCLKQKPKTKQWLESRSLWLFLCTPTEKRVSQLLECFHYCRLVKCWVEWRHSCFITTITIILTVLFISNVLQH